MLGSLEHPLFQTRLAPLRSHCPSGGLLNHGWSVRSLHKSQSAVLPAPGRLTCISEYSATDSRRVLYRFLELLLYLPSSPLILCPGNYRCLRLPASQSLSSRLSEIARICSACPFLHSASTSPKEPLRRNPEQSCA